MRPSATSERAFLSTTLAAVLLLAAAPGSDAAPDMHPERTGDHRVRVEAATVSWRTGKPAGRTGEHELSNDGQTVLFQSSAKSLVPNPPGQGLFHLYARDLVDDTTQVVTSASDGTPAPGSSWTGMGLSGDGRFAAFKWNAPELAPTGTRPGRWAYVKDLRTGRLDATRVRGSGPTAGYPMLGHHVLAISRHGRYVAGDAAFDTGPGFDGVVSYLLDRRTDRFRWLSPINASARVQALSDDGRYVLYSLNPYDEGSFGYYRFDRRTGRSTPVPRAPITDLSVIGKAEFSGNGRIMVLSWQDNFVGGSNVLVYRGPGMRIVEELNPGEPMTVDGVDATGRFLSASANPDGDRHFQTYRLDRRTDEYILVSRNADGQEGSRNSGGRGISSDGRTLLFRSLASNLVPGDAGGFDAFVATISDAHAFCRPWSCPPPPPD